jgi:methionine-rich copper-binding protein CopC
VDTEDAFKLNADSIVFSEMIARDKSHTEVTNSVCQGQTIHLGALDDAYLAFRNGEVWSYVSAWKNATMVLESSIIDWEKGKKWHGYIYQTRNIAHDNSRLYCLNTVMREKPEAMDKAVALFAFIEPLPQARIGSKITIRGSAWVKAGPQSQVAFDSYELSWSVIGSDDWNLIHSSSTEVREGEMGTWDTSDLKPGNYRIRLKVITSGDKVTGQYPAYREVEIAATST